MTYVEPAVAQAVDELDNDITGLFGLKPAIVRAASTSVPARQAPTFVYPQATGYAILLNYMRGNLGYTQLDPTIPVSQWRFDVETAIYVANLANYSQQIAISTGDGLTGAKSYTQAILHYVQAGVSAAAAGSVQQAIGVAEALYNASEGDIRNEGVARAQGDAHAVAVAYSYRNQAIGAANAHSDAIHLQLSNDVTIEQHARADGDAHAVAVAGSLSGAALANANAHTDAVHSQLSSDIVNQGNRLELAVTNGVSTAEAFATNAANQAELNAVATAVTQVQPTLLRVATEVDTCLAPLCDTVTPNAKQLGNLGKYLKGFEALGAAALLAGLVGEAIVNPGPAAAAIVATGGWLDTVATDLVDAVAGG